MFAIKGNKPTNVLDGYYVGNAADAHTTQIDFLSFITRVISQETDPQKLLTLTLEHSVSYLDVSSGEIWLFSKDGKHLELASSLTPDHKHNEIQEIERGRGLLGWVANQKLSFSTRSPSKDPRYDPEVDSITGTVDYSLLAVPMRTLDEGIGVLAFYDVFGGSITDHEAILMEGVASFSASGFMNAQMMQALEEKSTEQNVLFEMSRHIASGLDLQTTLDRALPWISQMIDVEVSCLWLIDDAHKTVELTATLGLEPKRTESISIPQNKGFVGRVIDQGNSLMINDPQSEPRFTTDISELLGIYPRNLAVLALQYRGRTIGVLSLINKVGGVFHDAELTLLSSAADMIAIAVGNARLLGQKQMLLEERDCLHTIALQTARLATIGRLTATLSHEINNPMQAIRGALVLSMEELDDAEALEDYINLSLHESDRVVQLVNRMQQIYNPGKTGENPVPLNGILQDITPIMEKELSKHDIVLRTDFAADLPESTGFNEQLDLVFLSLILTLADAIKEVGGIDLTIRSSLSSSGVLVEILTKAKLPEWVDVFGPDHSPIMAGSGFGLSFSQDIIVALGGTITLRRMDSETSVTIELPLPTNIE